MPEQALGLHGQSEMFPAKGKRRAERDLQCKAGLERDFFVLGDDHLALGNIERERQAVATGFGDQSAASCSDSATDHSSAVTQRAARAAPLVLGRELLPVRRVNIGQD